MTRDPTHPLPDDVEAERIDATRQAHERRHFIFATVLVMGCMLSLPVVGALYVLFLRWGWLPSPIGP